MPRCKKGDLAIVTGGMYNRGVILTCLELVYEIPDCNSAAPPPYWRVDRQIKWTSALTGITTFRSYIPDCRLTPLTGDPLEEDVDQEIKLTEKVPA